MRLSARPSLVAFSCCRLVPSSYQLAFRLPDTVCRVACPLLPGFPPPLLSSISTLSALQVSVVVPSGSLLRYHVKSLRCGLPSVSSLSQSSIVTKALPPPSWCLVGVFAMRSPCWVEFVSALDRNVDSSRTFPTGWCRVFTLGPPVLGRVAYFCALGRNDGFFFYPSILSCFAMDIPSGWGHPFRVWI